MWAKYIFVFLIPALYAFPQNAKIQPYFDYVNSIEKQSAKEYILEKFRSHDIVILCERDHRDLSQYYLIKEILADSYFKEHVKNLFTEVGIINLQPEVTDFLKTRWLDSTYVEKRISEFQQNSTFWALWENYNFHYLLRTIYDINNSSENQISYFPSDVEFDWSNVLNVADFTREMDYETEPRDSLIAYNIINRYNKGNSDGKMKALVIMNYRHAFKIHTENTGTLNKNVGKYLFDYFGDRVTNILLNQAVFRNESGSYVFSLIQNGKWDATFKKLNIDDIGFDLPESPFGKDYFDLWNGDNGHIYSNAFDGFVFYKPIEEFNLVSGYEGLITNDFEQEFIRRVKINSAYDDNKGFLEKLEDPDFQKAMINEMNTKRESHYPNLEELIELRDGYLEN